MISVVFVLISIIVALLYWVATRNFNHWKKKNVPYDQPLPFVGNFLDLLTGKRDLGGIIYDIHKSSKAPFTGFFSLNRPSLLIRDPESIKNVLIRDFDHFTDRVFGSNLDHDDLTHRTLFGVKGMDKWRQMRAKWSVMFTAAKLKVIFGQINEISQKLENVFEEISEGDGNFDAKEYFTRFTVDVIANTAFGLNENSIKNASKSQLRRIAHEFFAQDLYSGLLMFFAFFAPEYLRLTHLTPYKRNVFKNMENLIMSSVRYRKENGIVRNDFLDVMVGMVKDEHSDDYDQKSLVAQAMGFFIAGFETSSTTSSFVAYQLALNPTVQEKVREEIRDVLRAHNGEVNYDSVNEMTYLHQVIEETMRMYPILPYIDRVCTKKYHIPNSDVVIDPGTIVYISSIAMHSDPNYYENPEKFDPNRFKSGNLKGSDRIINVSFGEGPRNCVGLRLGYLQVKLGLIRLLRKFSIEPTNETEIPLVMSKKQFTSFPANGVKLRLRKVE